MSNYTILPPKGYDLLVGNEQEPTKSITTEGINTLLRNHAYNVGDVVEHTSLPLWATLECSVAGVTSSEPLTGLSSVQPYEVISDGTVKWRVSSKSSKYSTMGVLVATAPAYYQRQGRPKVAKTVLTLPRLWVNIGESGFVINSDMQVNLNDSNVWDNDTYATPANRMGKDFYYYVCQPTDGTSFPVIKLSANSTTPTGYTALNSRKLGGFHCECKDVGTISGHLLSGYKAGDAIPASIWDLKHRPVSDPEGMLFALGIWSDIYLPSWDGNKLVSRYNAVVADGYTPECFHGEKFVEKFGLINKRLLWRDEFMCLAKGSNEATAIKGATDPNTTGGHVDTADRRMISNFGHEDMCGAYWQWTRDTFEGSSENSSAYGASQKITQKVYHKAWKNKNISSDQTYITRNADKVRYVHNYEWNDASVYNSFVDPISYGSCLGLLRRSIVGGSWDDASACGSRCVDCNDFGSGVAPNISARGASESLENL